MEFLEKKQQIELLYLVSYESNGRTRFGYSQKNVTDRDGFILVYPCENLNPEDDGFGIMVKPVTIKYSPYWEQFKLKSIKEEKIKNWFNQKQREKEERKIQKKAGEPYSVESEIKAIIQQNYEPLIILLNEKHPDLTVYSIFLSSEYKAISGYVGDDFVDLIRHPNWKDPEKSSNDYVLEHLKKAILTDTVIEAKKHNKISKGLEEINNNLLNKKLNDFYCEGGGSLYYCPKSENIYLKKDDVELVVISGYNRYAVAFKLQKLIQELEQF